MSRFFIVMLIVVRTNVVIPSIVAPRKSFPPFLSSVIFVRKATPPLEDHLLGRLLTLPTNIRLGWKVFPGATTLALWLQRH